MFFVKKNYLAVPMSKMKIYEDDDRNKIIGEVDINDGLLSDGTDVMLFFEYSPKNLRDYGVIKELATGVSYTREFGFRDEDNCLYSESTGTIYFDNDLQSGFSLKYPTRNEVKQYMKNLKNKNLYKEYVTKISNFYNNANKMRNDTIGKNR